jgi:hypothetical protein
MTDEVLKRLALPILGGAPDQDHFAEAESGCCPPE